MTLPVPDPALHVRALAALARGVQDRAFHRAVADHVLTRHHERVRSDRELLALADAVALHLRHFDEWVRNADDAKADGEGSRDVAAFPLDLRAVEWLETCALGEVGEQVRTETREAALARWEDQQDLLRLWGDEGEPPDRLRFATILADALWRARVEGAVTLRAPALVMPVLEHAVPAYFARGRAVEETNDGTVVIRRGAAVAMVDCSSAPPMASSLREGSGLEATETLAAHRLFRWLVHKGHIQRHVLGLRDFARIEVDGGLTGLASELGLRSNKDRTRLRSILTWMQYACVRAGATIHHGLLTWTESRTTMSIRVGDLLLPGREQLGAKGTSARKLIPLPITLPPLVGRPNDHGAQAALQLLALRDLRLGAEDLAAGRGVEIDRRRWAYLADEVGLPVGMLDDVLRAWTDGEDQAPAFLTSPARDRWDLAEAYAVEREVIVDGGLREVKGREAGQRAAARRRAKAAA